VVETKFILAGFPRTGTTVLAGSLILHPQVLFYGELFNNTKEVRHTEAQRITLGAGWKFEEALDWGISACRYTESTNAYVDEFFARKIPFNAIGFKIMYDQVTEGPNSDVWDYLAAHPEIKIIRTKRENLIEIICSFVRASMTRRWHTTGEELPSHRFIVPPQEFLALMKRFETLPEPMYGIDETHQILELDYHRISTDFQGCMRDIYSFLELESGSVVSPRLKKIARLKPNKELANYEELKQHFQNTQYSKYFTF